jgi:hypothetical protein
LSRGFSKVFEISFGTFFSQLPSGSRPQGLRIIPLSTTVVKGVKAFFGKKSRRLPFRGFSSYLFIYLLVFSESVRSRAAVSDPLPSPALLC